MKKFSKNLLAISAFFATLATSCNGGSKIKINPNKDKYIIGICQIVDHNALNQATQGFKDQLKARLEAENRTVEFKYKDAAGDSTLCTTIVNEFVSSDVDLIMANATACLQAAFNATETIPILGTSITDYGVALNLDIKDGFIGSNVSGTSDLAPLDTQAQMILDLVPDVSKVGILYCSAEANSKFQVKTVKDYLEGKNITVTEYPFSDTNDISSVCNSAISNAEDAMFIPTDNTAANAAEFIGSLFNKKIPIIAGEESLCKACGIATLSISYYSIGKVTGDMAADVLLGKSDITKMAIKYDNEPVKKYDETRCSDFGISVGDDYIKLA